MPIVPKKIAEKVAFYQERAPIWSASATALGLNSGEMTLMTGKVTAAASALTAANDAKSLAKSKTIDLHDSVRAMDDFGASLIKTIKGKAEQDGNSVYSIARLPVPATPTPKPPPGQPIGAIVTIDVTGVLTLTWKCENPPGSTGTMYQVWRRIGPSGDFVFLGGVGTKKFEDDTLPAGSTSVCYQIQAVRSTQVGPWNQFNVNFGVNSGGGAMVASVTEGTPTPIAA